MQTWLAAVTVAFGVVVATATAPSPASSAIVWCPSPPPANYGAGGPPAFQTWVVAETDLCNGAFSDANAAFASILPTMTQMHRNDGKWWYNTVRGSFFSMIATSSDVQARRLLDSVEKDAQWAPHPADRLFWNGDVRGALAQYAIEVGSLDNYPDGAYATDANIKAAVQADADLNAAISILARPPEPEGSSDVGTLQLLMLGDAYESQRQWNEAFTAWVNAADNGHAVPESDYFDTWNLDAMEMIYYYRAHVPTVDRPAR